MLDLRLTAVLGTAHTPGLSIWEPQQESQTPQLDSDPYLCAQAELNPAWFQAETPIWPALTLVCAPTVTQLIVLAEV